MKTRIENAILKNLLAEAMRVYEQESATAGAEGPGHPPASTRRRGNFLRPVPSDSGAENAILRNLLAATAKAYEERFSAFRAEKELVRHVLAATRDAVLTVDTQGAVTSLNPAAEDLTGWSLDEARGRRVGQVLTLVDEDGAAAGLDLAPCLREGRQFELDPGLRITHRDGWTRSVDGHAAAIHDRLRGVLGAVLILRRLRV